MLSDLLEKYRNVKPKDFGDYKERSYPVGCVIDMLNEFAEYKLEEQRKKVNDFLMTKTSLEVEKIVDLMENLNNKTN